MSDSKPHVAVIGAGVAGAACARFLSDAGLNVQVFDKSRGVGGRLATRRLDWPDATGTLHPAHFDHGAPCFSAHSSEFAGFTLQAQREGLLSRWTPRMAPGSEVPLSGADLWVPVPDMPALCRNLLANLPVQTSCTVDALRREPDGWSVQSLGADLNPGQRFAAVVIAIPPQQAALLLQPHQTAWAQHAQAQPMLPTWTLMGITNDDDGLSGWDLACPPSGPLAWVVRNDAKPGRVHVPGLAHWIVHATTAWSQIHLEAPTAEVQAVLQQALAQWLGRPLMWHHAATHRWRYASAIPSNTNAIANPHQWDASLGLGVCGDVLGGAGVEGAWLSARSLAEAIVASQPGSLNSIPPPNPVAR
jgi:renalase